MPWEHGVAGSNPAAETTSLMRVLGCGRSSMAELRDVTPLVPVRLRPATPKRMRHRNPLVAEQADAPVSETGAARHVRSTRTEGTINDTDGV